MIVDHNPWLHNILELCFWAMQENKLLHECRNTLLHECRNELLHECRNTLFCMSAGIHYCMSAGMSYCMSVGINFHKSKGQSPIRVQYLRLHRNSYVQQNCLAMQLTSSAYNTTTHVEPVFTAHTYYLCVVHRKSLKTRNSCNLCLVHTSTVLKCSCV